MLQSAAFAFFPVIVTLAAVSDLMTMTISNRFSVALVVGFALLAPWLPGMDLALAGMHLASAALVLAITFTLFAFGIIGGGDAKLAAVIALWLGWEPLFAFTVYTAVIGGALCIALLAFRSLPIPIFAMRQDWIMRLHDREEGAPYGIALAASAMLVYPDSLWSALLG